MQAIAIQTDVMECAHLPQVGSQELIFGLNSELVNNIILKKFCGHRVLMG